MLTIFNYKIENNRCLSLFTLCTAEVKVTHADLSIAQHCELCIAVSLSMTIAVVLTLCGGGGGRTERNNYPKAI